MPIQYPRRQKQLEKLIQMLGLASNAPIRWELLDRALTHPTASTQGNYEQLEFLGDAVVRLVAAELLWERYANLAVGEFTAIRSILVSDRTLARLAAYYNLENYLTAASSIFRDKLGEESRLAESFEAVLGALYLSTHNLTLIRPWLDVHFQQLVEEIRSDPARQNYKAALQEWTQATYKILPEYRVSEIEAADLANRFVAEVWLHEECLGRGSGRSIKAAEQAAAQAAFWVVVQQKQAAE
ncbi:MAG: ribonuclease III [Oscillatoriales cyanobacterium C42_A2020_001]|nr:ribonuclease III [Leptolyngbyaceae cyanobacterium C42_A2020_001]